MRILLVTIAFLVSLSGYSQAGKEISTGIYLPYLVQPGFNVGLELPVNENQHFLQPNVSFFHQSGVGSNYSVRLDYNYRIYSGEKGWEVKLGSGIGYLLSNQQVDGSVNLATGEVERNSTSTSNFQPLAHVTLKKAGKKNRGVYFKLIGGSSINSSSSTFFTALEVGMTWKITKNSRG